MRKRSLLIALLLLTAMAAAPFAYADTVTDLLVGFGMSDAEAEAFAALVAGMKGEVTEQDINDLLSQFPAGETGKPLAGSLQNNIYTDPIGYAFTVPAGWALQDTQIGPTVVLTGPVDESGMMPTITVLVVTESGDSLLSKTKEEIDAALGQSLANYMSIALDSFEFQGNQARELVCTYGTSEDSMLMQHQLHFASQGRIYMVTLTTLAEETVHEASLDTFDTFLAGFTLSAAASGAQPTSAPVQETPSQGGGNDNG